MHEGCQFETVGMSELGTGCALFLRSFNKGRSALKLYYCSASISSLNRTHHRAAQPPPPPRRRRREDHRNRATKQTGAPGSELGTARTGKVKRRSQSGIDAEKATPDAPGNGACE